MDPFGRFVGWTDEMSVAEKGLVGKDRGVKTGAFTLNFPLKVLRFFDTTEVSGVFFLKPAIGCGSLLANGNDKGILVEKAVFGETRSIL